MTRRGLLAAAELYDAAATELENRGYSDTAALVLARKALTCLLAADQYRTPRLARADRRPR